LLPLKFTSAPSGRLLKVPEIGVADVVTQGDEIVAFFWIDHYRLVAALKEMPAEPVSPVEADRPSGLEPAHI
jgi:hypothetical protein